MARLYADENFSYPTVKELRQLGHDVLTAREAGQAGQGIPDPDVLAFAIADARAVLGGTDLEPQAFHSIAFSHTASLGNHCLHEG